MATKTEIKNEIATIDTGGLNGAEEVRRVLGQGSNISASLIENFYRDSVNDRTNQSPESQIVTTKFGNDVVYNVVIAKVGGNVSVNGIITNNTLTPLTDPNLFTITLAEYTQDSNTYRACGTNNVGGNAELILSSNIFRFNGTLGIGEFLSFDFNYNTAD